MYFRLGGNSSLQDSSMGLYTTALRLSDIIPPKCHPRTRKAILREIMEWIDSPEGLAHFLWIFGPAGSGKSTIAQTIAEIYFKYNKLAASFFFSRNVAARNNESMLITTLVYQLARSFSGLGGTDQRSYHRAFE